MAFEKLPSYNQQEKIIELLKGKETKIIEYQETVTGNSGENDVFSTESPFELQSLEIATDNLNSGFFRFYTKIDGDWKPVFSTLDLKAENLYTRTNASEIVDYSSAYWNVHVYDEDNYEFKAFLKTKHQFPGGFKITVENDQSNDAPFGVVGLGRTFS